MVACAKRSRGFRYLLATSAVCFDTLRADINLNFQPLGVKWGNLGASGDKKTHPIEVNCQMLRGGPNVRDVFGHFRCKSSRDTA